MDEKFTLQSGIIFESEELNPNVRAVLVDWLIQVQVCPTEPSLSTGSYKSRYVLLHCLVVAHVVTLNMTCWSQ